MNINSEHTEGIANELKKPSIEETDKIKEKQEMVAKIKKICKGYNYFYKHSKSKMKEFKSELKQFNENLKDIKKTVNIEFSLESLQKTYNLINENYRRYYLILRIIKKAKDYSKLIKDKEKEIKNYKISRIQLKQIEKQLDEFLQFTSNMNLHNQINNNKLDDILMEMEKFGHSLVSTIENVISECKEQTAEELAEKNENEELYKAMKRFVVIYGLFGKK